MKLALRHKIPAVVGTAVLLAGAGGAVAFAVSGHGPDSTEIGNSLPIDDNHQAGDRGAEAEPGDDKGGLVTRDARTEPGDDRGTEAEPGDDNGDLVDRDARTEPGDDRDGATPVASSSPSGSGTEDRSGSGSDVSGSGSDDSGSGSSGSGSSGPGSDDGSGHDAGDDSGSGGHGSDG